MNTEVLDSNDTFLETLSNNIPGVIIYQYTYFAEGYGQFTYLSKNVEAYSGHSLAELYKNQELLKAFIDAADLDQIYEKGKISLQDLSLFDIEVKGMNVKGEPKYFHFSSIPFKQLNGNTIWNGILTDTTEKVLVDLKLKRTISELKLINQVSELIYNIHDEFNLTQEVCKYLVEFGNYELVWIGVKPEFDEENQNVKIAALNLLLHWPI
jgi:hypothetical protein